LIVSIKGLTDFGRSCSYHSVGSNRRGKCEQRSTGGNEEAWCGLWSSKGGSRCRKGLGAWVSDGVKRSSFWRHNQGRSQKVF
jgi:hypothetical protein